MDWDEAFSWLKSKQEWMTLPTYNWAYTILICLYKNDLSAPTQLTVVDFKSIFMAFGETTLMIGPTDVVMPFRMGGDA